MLLSDNTSPSDGWTWNHTPSTAVVGAKLPQQQEPVDNLVAFLIKTFGTKCLRGIIP